MCILKNKPYFGDGSRSVNGQCQAKCQECQQCAKWSAFEGSQDIEPVLNHHVLSIWWWRRNYSSWSTYRMWITGRLHRFAWFAAKEKQNPQTYFILRVTTVCNMFVDCVTIYIILQVVRCVESGAQHYAHFHFWAMTARNGVRSCPGLWAINVDHVVPTAAFVSTHHS